jgi:putative effector of murein hydrolase
LQVHPDAGAYAGIALGLQVLLMSVLMPLAFRLVR